MTTLTITLIVLAVIILLHVYLILKVNYLSKFMQAFSFDKILQGLDSTEKRLNDQLESKFANQMIKLSNQNSNLRQELFTYLQQIHKNLDTRLDTFNKSQTQNFKDFSESLNQLLKRNEEQLTNIRKELENKLHLLQKNNEEHLEKIRITVDEKLTSTLNLRLREQFKLISDRLEQVHKGLGEMQSLASNVGDLKKIFSGVKTRGIWGEVQLGNLLSQILTKDQYEENVAVKPRSQKRVEFAIKLPGKDDDKSVVWLPIDAKFPLEDYQRLVEASQESNAIKLQEALLALERRIKAEAKDIHEKYIAPPHTTDFAIMYLPSEGLYAEVAQRIGLLEELQNKYRVVVAGPSTISAFLNSLQMGFRTLAIEKRSGEVWSLLASIKTEFTKFGGLLAKTKKKLQEASNIIDKAESKNRNITRKLRKVETVPEIANTGQHELILPSITNDERT